MVKGTFKIEADGQMELKELFGDRHHYILTPEFCHADSAYACEPSKSAVLPVQNKFAHCRGADRPNGFVFTGCLGYNGMLVICRPLGVSLKCCYMIPGDLVNNTKLSVTLGCSHLSWALVLDAQLSSFMRGLYLAVERQERCHPWPDGTLVDISSLRLVPFQSLCMPKNAMQALAQSYADWRKSIMPFLEYSAPLQHQGTVDVVINGLRVQDKLGRAHGHRIVFYLTKNRYDQPYDHDDFDVLFGFFKDRQHVLIMPVAELVARGVLRSRTRIGKTSISCYPHGRPPSGGRRPGEMWTRGLYRRHNQC